MKKMSLIVMLALVSSLAQATTVGVSTHPFTMKNQVITTEFTNYNNGGAGKGINARYLRKLSDELNVDAGFGITNGKRNSSLYIGADYVIAPDYGRQPRFSLKGMAETTDFDGDRMNTLGIAPTLSKGFAFWGNEAFPFIALPMNLNFETENNTYFTSTALAVGITGRLPFAGYQNVVANLETNISVRKSYSAIILGLSVPIQ